MPNFLVRVQLKGAEPIDYTELHEAMEAIGLLRQIQSNEGEWFELPNAEYFGTRLNYSVVPLRERVRAIVTRTNPPGGHVLVSEVANAAWFLKPCE